MDDVLLPPPGQETPPPPTGVFSRSGPKVPPPPARPSTEASIVSDAALLLSETMGELSLRLRERLEPMCGPLPPAFNAPAEPRPDLASPYFSQVENCLYSIQMSMREIEATLDRLAV